MSTSDENTHPCPAYNSKARNRRRGSSLFQLQGEALLDILGDSNIPPVPSGSPKHSQDTCHSLPSETDSSVNHEHATLQNDAARAVGASISNTGNEMSDAAECFERWNAQPTSFPHPAVAFTGNAPPPPPSPRARLPHTHVSHFLAANRCAKAASIAICTAFPPVACHAGTITIAATALLAMFFLLAV
jgi:hypothetical protein